MSAVLELPTLEQSISMDEINEKSIIFALEERKHAAKILASEVQNILDRKTENIVQLSEKRTKR